MTFPACSDATCDREACANEIYLEVLHPRKYTSLFVEARLVKQSLQKPSGCPLTERQRKRARFWLIGVFVSATGPPAPPFLPLKLGSDRLFWDKVIFVRAPGGARPAARVGRWRRAPTREAPQPAAAPRACASAKGRGLADSRVVSDMSQTPDIIVPVWLQRWSLPKVRPWCRWRRFA